MEKVKKREAVYPKDLVVDKIYCDLENADKKPTLLKFVRVEDNACYFECLDNHFMYLGYNEGRKKIVGFFGLDHPFYLPTEKDYQELNIAQYENN